VKLTHPERFFAELRRDLFDRGLTVRQVVGINAIMDATSPWPCSWAAYGLATAYMETAQTMQPITEFGGTNYFFRRYDCGGARPDIAKILGNKFPGDGAMFCGRGYVQLTGRGNYQRADGELALKGDLIVNPARALEADIAAKVMEAGMREGWFTGRKLSDYLPLMRDATVDEFTKARKIINGADRAEIIADEAVAFQKALRAGA
jgi:putative chitinase